MMTPEQRAATRETHDRTHKKCGGCSLILLLDSLDEALDEAQVARIVDEFGDYDSLLRSREHHDLLRAQVAAVTAYADRCAILRVEPTTAGLRRAIEEAR